MGQPRSCKLHLLGRAARLDNLFSDRWCGAIPKTENSNTVFSAPAQRRPRLGSVSGSSCSSIACGTGEHNCCAPADRNGSSTSSISGPTVTFSSGRLRLSELEYGLRRARPPDLFRPRGSNSTPKAASTSTQALGGGTNEDRLQPRCWLSVSESGQVYVSNRRWLEARAPTYSDRAAAAGPKTGTRPHQGARSRNRQDDVGVQDSSRGRRLTNIRATAGNVVFGAVRDGNIVALDARPANTCGISPDRREHRRVADELCDRRPLVRRGRRGKHGLCPSLSPICESPDVSRLRIASFRLCDLPSFRRPGAVRCPDEDGDVSASRTRERDGRLPLPSMGNIAFDMTVKRAGRCCAGPSRRWRSSRPSRP